MSSYLQYSHDTCLTEDQAAGKTLCSINSLWTCGLKPATKIQEWKRSKAISQNMENKATSVLELEIWKFFYYHFNCIFTLVWYPCLVVCTSIFHWNLLFVQSRSDISEYSTLPTGLRRSSAYPGKKVNVPMSSLITAKQHVSSHSASENWKWPLKNPCPPTDAP